MFLSGDLLRICIKGHSVTPKTTIRDELVQGSCSEMVVVEAKLCCTTIISGAEYQPVN